MSLNGGATKQTTQSSRQMAFDFLSIPAMSSETERVFSQTKRTISDTRYRLGAPVIEAIEC